MGRRVCAFVVVSALGIAAAVGGPGCSQGQDAGGAAAGSGAADGSGSGASAAAGASMPTSAASSSPGGSAGAAGATVSAGGNSASGSGGGDTGGSGDATVSTSGSDAAPSSASAASGSGLGGPDAAPLGSVDAGAGDATSGDAGAGGPGACVSPVASTPTDWGKVFADAVLAQGFGSFAASSYPVGLFMHGLSEVYKRTKDPRYLDFLTTWANANSVVPSGRSVDEIMHMTAVADAYELSMSAKLAAPLTVTRRIFDSYPRTSDGAFWHNTTAKGQNWGDTSFMALSFLTRYGTVMNDATTFAEAVKQITLFDRHLENPATGLLFHAYDETATASWVVPGTHHSPETWGRAMGWYLMATVMVLEALPSGDPGRPGVEAILARLVTAVARYQDPATGRWYEVVDKGSTTGNWLETSASAMYSYVTFWAATRGLVDASYCGVASRGFKGVLQEVSASPAKLITGVCEGTGVGNFAYYVGRNHAQYDDFHGIGSFLLMWEGMR